MSFFSINAGRQVITLNILANEHKSGEFPKINPQTCVPTILDGDFMLWESKAILIYLATKSCGPFKGSFAKAFFRAR